MNESEGTLWKQKVLTKIYWDVNQLFHTTVHLKNQIQFKGKKRNLPADQDIVRYVYIYTMILLKR
jgi:hypothetical protein